MRRTILFLFALLSLMTAGAQTVKEVRDSVKSATKSGNLKEMAATLKGAFAAKSAKAEELVGTWVYLEPAVLATSDRMLSKMAGNAVADKVKNIVDDYFNRANITSENTHFTFNGNGTYSRSLAGKDISGTWMTAGEHVLLAVKNVQLVAMTSHMESDTLTLVAELSNTLGDIQKLGGFSDSKTNKTLVKLTKRLKFVQIGFLLTRKRR